MPSKCVKGRDAEHVWRRATEIAQKNYPSKWTKAKRAKVPGAYALVVGIYKRICSTSTKYRCAWRCPVK
jgi:hypothetical protein